jgi:hypothetical protein
MTYKQDSSTSDMSGSQCSFKLRFTLPSALLRAGAFCLMAVLLALRLQAQATLAYDGYRHSGNVGSNSVYDYAPSIMQDGKYRMWWCGAAVGPGDNILYAESTNVNGPYKAPNGTDGWAVVLKGTNNGTSFDSLHTCDPSVLRVNGTYFTMGVYKAILVPTQRLELHPVRMESTSRA